MSSAIFSAYPKFTRFKLIIATTDWSSDQSWPQSDDYTVYPTNIFGETASTCCRAIVGANCSSSDAIEIYGYSQSACKTPLYVYTAEDSNGNGQIRVYTATAPSDAIVIYGVILHP